MAYDEYGNVIQSINARGFSARTEYDAQYRTYPVKLTNALNQNTSYVYTASSPYGGIDGYLIGQPNAVTDANGQTAHTAFDPLGRASATYAPGETCPSTAYTYDNFSPGGSDRRFYVKSRARKYSGCAEEYLILYTFFDGLARPVQTKQLNGDSPDNQIIHGTRRFNNRGLVEREYVPYQASDTNKDLFEPPGSTPYISYSYDAIGRPVSVVRPDGGQTTVAYDRRKTTVTDANGHSRATVVDAFGRVAQVLEYNAGQTYTTSYTYTPLGQLSTLTDALGHQATMRYDSLGRKIELADFDMGTLSYSYDAAANQVSQTDSRGVTIRFEYDALNRLTRKDYPAGRDTTYVYDSCAFGVGRVCRVRDASGWESYTYDNLGRVVATTKALDGQLYTTQTEYDLLGRTLSVTYPDRQTVTYGYDAAGRLQSVSGGPQGTGYIHDISYNPLGQVTQVFYNNGVTSRYVYEDQTYRLKEINTTNNAGGTLQSLRYGFDAVGNITSIEDLVAGNRQAFAYDDLDRLTRAALTASGGAVLEDIAYAYDAIGNLRSKGGIIYAYDDPQHVHAVSSTSDGRNYTYDANGNLLSDGLRSFTYDYDNRPVRIAVRQPNSQMIPELRVGVAEFTYDAAGKRVKKVTASGGKTLYVGGLYEENRLSKVRHIYAGGLLIASSDNRGRTYFLHGDNQSSTVATSDGSGRSAGSASYRPFGSLRSNTIPTEVNELYTGQVLDAETGLAFYNARYYDPELARFLSPDAIVSSPLDPQSLNRYSYVTNNPLRYTDPTGNWRVNFRMGPIRFEASNKGVVIGVGIVTLGYNNGTATIGVYGVELSYNLFLFEPLGKVLEGLGTRLQVHLVTVGQGADIRQVQGLIQEATEGWLGEPVVKGDRRCICRMGGAPLLEQVLGDAQLAVIQVAGVGLLFLAALPDAQQVTAPLPGSGLLQRFFAGLERYLRRPQTLFELCQVHRLPELKEQRIVCIVITVVQGYQIVRPHIACADVVEQCG